MMLSQEWLFGIDREASADQYDFDVEAKILVVESFAVMDLVAAANPFAAATEKAVTAYASSFAAVATVATAVLE